MLRAQAGRLARPALLHARGMASGSQVRAGEGAQLATRPLLWMPAAPPPLLPSHPACWPALQLKLPDLPYDYGALEPVIIGEIMELHHKKHHQARGRLSVGTVCWLNESGPSHEWIALCPLPPTTPCRTKQPRLCPELPGLHPLHTHGLVLQAYVTGANTALEQYEEAQHKGDVSKIIALQARVVHWSTVQLPSCA